MGRPKVSKISRSFLALGGSLWSRLKAVLEHVGIVLGATWALSGAVLVPFRFKVSPSFGFLGQNGRLEACPWDVFHQKRLSERAVKKIPQAGVGIKFPAPSRCKSLRQRQC